MIRVDDTNDTLPKCVLRNGTATPSQIAMRRKTLGIWHRITWGEVLANVRDIGAGLLALDLATDPCIVILGNNEPELFWAEYAVQAIGKAAVCLYPDASEAELANLVRDCGARVAFAEDQEQCDKLLEIADRADLRTIIYWDDRGMSGYDDPRVISLAALAAKGRETLAATPDLVDRSIINGRPEDLAVVIYTSGTTGDAKGVMGTHRYLMDCALRWRDVLDAAPFANYVSYISPAWATEQYLGLGLGAVLPMIVNFPEEPETVTTDTREIGAEFLFFSSRQWEAIVSSTESRMRDAGWLARSIYRWGMKTLVAKQQSSPGLLPRFKRAVADALVANPMRDRLGFKYLRTAVNSGSALSPEVFDLFHALGVSLRNVYGFTEVGIVAATRGERRFGTVGKPLESRLGTTPLETRIENSEIQVRGGVIFDGYYGKPDATAARSTPDGWMRSGDAGYFEDDGYLVYLDRLDDLRRLSSGETIAPQFIEARIRLSPYVRDVVIIGDASRDYVGALIDIDIDLVGKWAEERQISFSVHADLSQKAEVLALVRSELERINETLPAHCRVVRFINLFKSFDADEGELTRSRKIRRTVVEQKYKTLIDAIYGDREIVSSSVEVKFQDGRSRTMQADVTVCSMSKRQTISSATAPAGG
jgi:long-chain acyl-CoA synthetase